MHCSPCLSRTHFWQSLKALQLLSSPSFGAPVPISVEVGHRASSSGIHKPSTFAHRTCLVPSSLPFARSFCNCFQIGVSALAGRQIGSPFFLVFLASSDIQAADFDAA